MILTPTIEAFTQEDQRWLGSAHGTDACPSITLDTSAFTSGTHYPAGFFPSGLPLGKITASGLYGPYAGRTTEVQTVTITGTPTGGTFTLSFGGETTAGIAFNATAAQVKAALDGLADVNASDLTVTGTQLPGGTVTVSFTGQYSGDNVPAMTAASGSLTGGSTPTAVVATGTGGASGAADGTETLAGHLFCTVKAPTNNLIDVPAALFEHGRVVTAFLPLPVDSAGRRDVGSRIRYV